MESKSLKDSLDSATTGLQGMMDYILKNVDKAQMSDEQKKQLTVAKKNAESKLSALKKEINNLSKIKV